MRSTLIPLASSFALLVGGSVGSQLTAAASGPAASSLPAVGTTVHFEGCIRKGVENGCLIVETNGVTYNVTAGKAVLKVDQYAAGTGVVTDKVSFCMQGPVLEPITLDAKQPSKVCTQAPAAKPKSP